MDVSLEQQQQLQHDLQRLSELITRQTAIADRQVEQVNRIDARVTVLEALDERHSYLCPYRETIKVAGNNVIRMGDMEKRMGEVEKHIAKYSLLAGGAGTIVVSVVMKALGL